MFYIVLWISIAHVHELASRRTFSESDSSPSSSRSGSTPKLLSLVAVDFHLRIVMKCYDMLWNAMKLNQAWMVGQETSTVFGFLWQFTSISWKAHLWTQLFWTWPVDFSQTECHGSGKPLPQSGGAVDKMYRTMQVYLGFDLMKNALKCSSQTNGIYECADWTIEWQIQEDFVVEETIQSEWGSDIRYRTKTARKLVLGRSH